MEKKENFKTTAILISTLLLFQSGLLAYAAEAGLKLQATEINASTIDPSSNLLIIEDAEGLSTTLTIKHKEKVLKPVRIKANLENNNLVLDLSQILPVQFLPEGEYTVIARQGNKKVIGKFNLNPPNSILGRL